MFWQPTHFEKYFSVSGLDIFLHQRPSLFAARKMLSVKLFYKSNRKSKMQHDALKFTE